MKLKYILSIVCLFCLLLSCSTENDIPNDTDKQNNLEAGQAGNETLIVFNAITSVASATKVNAANTEKPTDAESVIEHCSLILADAQGTILAANDQVYLNNTATFTVNGVEHKNIIVALSATSGTMVKYYVKAGKKYQVMIVANSDRKLASFSTLSEVENEIQQGFPGSLVKVGYEVLDLTDEEGIKQQSGDNEPTVFASVTLQQLTARIELTGFTVEKFINGTLPADVVIREIEVSNINTKSYLTKNAKYGTSEYTSDSKKYEEGKGITVYQKGATLNEQYLFPHNNNVHSFYSYRNSADADKKLTMTIHYTAGGAIKKTKPIEINRADNGGSGGIDSNTIYRLFVNASVTSDELLLDNVFCYPEDWIPVDINLENLAEVKK